MPQVRLKILLVVACVVAVSGAIAFAGKWKPFEFKGAAFYKFRITQHEDDGAKQIVYSVDVQEAQEKSPDGEALWRVTTSTQSLMTADELKGATIFGASPLLALAPTLMMGNPLFAGMIGEMELAVGEKMSFFGAGKAVVVKKETVAGVEGFLCELYMKQGEEEAKVAELVVHPDLAFPLRSKSFQDGKLQFEMELLEYKKH